MMKVFLWRSRKWSERFPRRATSQLSVFRVRKKTGKQRRRAGNARSRLELATSKFEAELISYYREGKVFLTPPITPDRGWHITTADLDQARAGLYDEQTEAPLGRWAALAKCSQKRAKSVLRTRLVKYWQRKVVCLRSPLRRIWAMIQRRSVMCLVDNGTDREMRGGVFKPRRSYDSRPAFGPAYHCWRVMTSVCRNAPPLYRC